MKLKHGVFVLMRRRYDSLEKFMEYRFNAMGCDGLESAWAVGCYLIAALLGFVSAVCFAILISKL